MELYLCDCTFLLNFWQSEESDWVLGTGYCGSSGGQCRVLFLGYLDFRIARGRLLNKFVPLSFASPNREEN